MHHFIRLISFLVIVVLLLTPITASAQTVEPNREIPPLDKTRYLTLSAADFRPANSDLIYEAHGRYLKAFGNSAAPTAKDGHFYAPVVLPSGSIITKMTLFFHDNNNFTNLMEARLYVRTSDTSVGEVAMVANNLTGVQPIDKVEYGHSTDPLNIPYSAFYTYFVDVRLPFSKTDGSVANWLCGIKIEYTEPDRLPTVDAITLPASTARPINTNATFSSFKDSLRHETYSGGVNSGSYLVPLNLPSGAQILSLSVLYSSYSNRTAKATLHRSETSLNNDVTLGQIDIPAGTQVQKSLTTEIAGHPVVDNKTYSYWAILNLPPVDGSYYFDATRITVAYWLPQTPPVTFTTTVSAAAFTPFRSSYTYGNLGNFMRHKSTPAGVSEGTHGLYMAPLTIPDGAILKKIIFNGYDSMTGTDNNIKIRLQRSELGKGDYDTLKLIENTSSGGYVTPGVPDLSDIDTAVDMKKYSYWVLVDMPVASVSGSPTTNDVVFQSVEIDYEYTFVNTTRVYLPAINK